MQGAYERAYRESVQNPEAFWGKEAEKVPWYRKHNQVLNRKNPPFYRWFEGGSVNSCYAALDIHCENGRRDNVALIYDSPVTDTRKNIPTGNSGTLWHGVPADSLGLVLQRETAW